jgi:hypothetical protein
MNKNDIKLSPQFHRFSTGALPNLEVRTAQAALLFLGFSVEKINGILWPRTKGFEVGWKSFYLRGDCTISSTEMATKELTKGGNFRPVEKPKLWNCPIGRDVQLRPLPSRREAGSTPFR